MFYGASTIPQINDYDNDDNQTVSSAVGSLLCKMRKYVAWLGPGALVFMHGCGAQLAQQLDDIGVTALACFGNDDDLDLRPVWNHQKTCCADAGGRILP